MENTEMLVQELLEAKEAYYNDKPIMADEAFDSLEDKLREFDPDNNYFNLVGFSASGKKQVKHNPPMLSCGKTKTVEQVQDWVKKIHCEDELFITMPKIDGLSGKVTYKNGKAIAFATRGDGHIGQDITDLIPYMDSIPNTISNKETINVYGEIYISKYNTVYPKGTALRNVATGLVNRKDRDSECKNLQFVAYRTDTQFSLFSDSLDFIEDDLGFDTVVSFTKNIAGIKEIRDLYLSKLREDWVYETDGLVIQVQNTSLYEKIDADYVISRFHRFNIALKPPSQGKETTLQNIDWQVSRFGAVVPVAIFDTINLGDRDVSRATLNNYENVKNLDLCYNDKVFIKLGNDVIPFFDRVITPSNDIGVNCLLIDKCPCCGSSLHCDGVNAVCNNEYCPDRVIKQIAFWCKASNMDNISEATIKSLYEKGYVKSVNNLYSLDSKKDCLLNEDGFGESKVNNLIAQIEKSKSVTIQEFIYRLGIPLVGKRAIEKLGINTLEEFISYSDDSYVIGKNLIDFIANNIDFINNLLAVVNIKTIEKKVDSSIEKVAMTGKGPKGRKELIVDIEAKGYQFASSVTKETNILLCEDVNGTSSKLVKARKDGIELMSYLDFFA